MKHVVIMTVALVCAHFTTVWAQPSCGAYSRTNNLRTYPQNPTALELIVQTNRDVVACPLEVQAEGWVDGVGGASTARGVHSAEVRMIVPVGINGSYTSTGKHWLIWNGGATWEFLGHTFGGPALVTGGMCVPPIPDWVCTDGGGRPSANGCNCEYDTPIIVDVAGDGYRLTSIDDGVFFDIDADGQLEQVSWTQADSDDAFLAIDRNGNGRIDDGSELFGNYTPAYNDQAEPRSINGFVATSVQS